MMTSAKSPSPCKISCSLVLGIRHGWGQEAAVLLCLPQSLGIWGWSISVESGCLPEDTLIIKVSKPSLLSLLILLATYFHFCISRLTILSCFISPCLWSNIVQDKTTLIPKRDKGAATGLHKRKIISECKFTNFVQNILGNSDSQIVSISIPGTFAH